MNAIPEIKVKQWMTEIMDAINTNARHLRDARRRGGKSEHLETKFVALDAQRRILSRLLREEVRTY